MLNLTDTGKARLRALSLTHWAIWIAMCSSIVVLIFAAQQPRQEASASNLSIEELRSVLTLSALIVLACAFWLGRWAYSESRLASASRRPLPVGEPFGEANAKLPEMEARVFSTLGTGFGLWVVALALSESASVLGFILALQSQVPSAIYPFALGSIVVNLFLAPNLQKVVTKALNQ